MEHDEKCKYRENCGYDFCEGEGTCTQFEEGEPIECKFRDICTSEDCWGCECKTCLIKCEWDKECPKGD